MREEGDILSSITPRFRADFAGLDLTLKSSIGNIERNFLLCHSFPIRRNSISSGFSFSLFVDTHDWTEVIHDCIPFSPLLQRKHTVGCRQHRDGEG